MSLSTLQQEAAELEAAIAAKAAKVTGLNAESSQNLRELPAMRKRLRAVNEQIQKAEMANAS